MQATPQQRQAIEITDRNLIVTAGAGSGKTSVLVQRFMHLLMVNPDWELTDIVAITFTEKAAREMRERIRDAIREQVMDNTLAGDVRQRWQHHENNLDSARISTIHGLCSRILRANPVEAVLDPRFEVLDEVDASTLQDEVVENTLAYLVETGAASADLLPQFEVRNVRQILKRMISNGIFDAILADEGRFSADNLWMEWRELWADANERTIQHLRANTDFEATIAIFHNMDFPANDKLSGMCQIVLDNSDVLYEGDLEAVLIALDNLSKGIKVNVGSAKNWGGKDIVTAVKADLVAIRDECKNYLKILHPPLHQLDEDALQLTQYWRELLWTTRQNYQHAKAERQLLDFDDLEQMTVALLENHPKIATRYAQPERGEFRHIMVDEFQDTNDAQRRIIYALGGVDIDNKTAPAGKLFVVGDPKQSIYAFRGADVSVFHRVSTEIQEANGQRVDLSQSFRTHSHLVEAFNRVFGDILTVDASSLAQDYHVDFGTPMDAFRSSAEHHTHPIHFIMLPKDEEAKGDERRWEAYELATHIQQMVTAETPIFDKRTNEYRPMMYGDVAVLFRAMSNIEIYEDVLQALEIPYITVAGRGYFDQPEIADMQNLLRALHNPADDLALASALRAPFFNFSDDLLLTLRLRTLAPDDRDPLPLWEALLWSEESLEHWLDVPFAEFFRYSNARDILSVLHGLAGRVTIADLLQHALDLTGFEAALMSLPNGERKRANILKFIQVAQHSQKVSLGAFNLYLRDIVASEAREGAAAIEPDNTVTLMTVHKSKGLEFPVIVLADTSYGGRNNTDILLLTQQFGLACKWEDENKNKPFIYNLTLQFEKERELAEQKRLLYVGATRARDYLVISGQIKGGASWLAQLRDLFGMSKDDIAPNEHYIWNYATLHCPPKAPNLASLRPRRAQHTLWDNPLPENNLQPSINLPLLNQVPPQIPPIRHIGASDLGMLGQVRDSTSEIKLTDFQRRILRGAPAPIRPILDTTNPASVPAYMIGNIVHRALQMQIVETDLKLIEQRAILQSYAWKEGLTNPEAVEKAIDESLKMLQAYRDSDLRDEIANAKQVYRELEFAYRKGDYMIHGIIDLLIFTQWNKWVVVDFKTDFVNWLEEEKRRDYASHSQQYIYQLGAYAEAVEEITGRVDEVKLYYLRHNWSYRFVEDDWRKTMSNLNFEITEMLTKTYFTNPDTWHGGFYELSLNITGLTQDSVLNLLKLIWQHPSLKGCYLWRNKEPYLQERVEPSIENLGAGYHVFGLATMPNGVKIACGTVFIGGDTPDDLSWLNLYLPDGALDEAYNIQALPVDIDEYDYMMSNIESWFATLAQDVYAQHKFSLGLIGYEVYGDLDMIANGVPNKRDMGFLVSENGELKYYPRTKPW